VFRHLAGPGAAQWSTLAATFRTDDDSAHLRAFLGCLPPPLSNAAL